MIGLVFYVASTAAIAAGATGAQVRGAPAIPAIYHGKWASNLRECGMIDGIYRIISAQRIEGFEFHGRPLRVSAIRRHAAPDGQAAQTVLMRVAWEFEGEPETANVRLSRVGGQMVISNADEVAEAEHFANPFIRCPAGPRR